MTSEHDFEENEGVRITDRRRIDPETGEVRSPVGDPAHAAASAPESATAEPSPKHAQSVEAEVTDVAEAAELIAAQANIAELTNDLQRVAAEYKNFRDRTARDLQDARMQGRIDAFNELISTLDDLDRAAAHGDLTGPMKALADNLTAALTKLGLERYGVAGEPFDPKVHEALTHVAEEGHEQATVQLVYEPGYRVGERIIRAARVGVVE